MFVIIRTLKVEKGYVDKFQENFHKPSPVTKSPGFVKKELYVSTRNKDYDELITKIYFKDKKAFYVWEGSPEHIAMHRNKDHAHNQKPEGVIEVTRQQFELISTILHD